jgi:cytochrome c553
VHFKPISWAGFLAGVLCWSAAILAADDQNEETQAACQACHVTPNPASRVPHLVGQRAAYLTNQLKAFKSGQRKDGFMNTVAAQLSDADIDNLAAFWSSQPAGSDLVVPPAADRIRSSRMPFPAAFPRGFKRYNTIFNAQDNTVGHSYVNARAFEAAEHHQPIADGSIVLVAVYKAQLDDKKQPMRDAKGEYLVGEIVNYSGMESREGWGRDIPTVLRNANWNYGVFNADKSPRAEINQAVCLACHKPAADRDFMYTLEKLQAKAAQP